MVDVRISFECNEWRDCAYSGCGKYHPDSVIFVHVNDSTSTPVSDTTLVPVNDRVSSVIEIPPPRYNARGDWEKFIERVEAGVEVSLDLWGHKCSIQYSPYDSPTFTIGVCGSTNVSKFRDRGRYGIEVQVPCEPLLSEFKRLVRGWSE